MRNCNNLLSISLGAAVVLHQTGAFVLPQRATLTHGSHSSESLRPNTKFYNSDTDDDSSSESIPSDTDPDPQPPAVESNDETSSQLKSKLYQLAASYDRGFAATPKARTEANEIIEQLAAVNPTENAARGIDGNDYSDDVPLKAIWRMVWTSAFDVVSLGASPIAAPSAIYQVITDPPIATNIIDFIPRAQSFFPSSSVPSSLLRAEVTTRASSRRGAADRVGLAFEGVKLQPIELLGQKVDNLPPLSVDLTWQQGLIDQVASFVPGLENLSSEGKDDADAPGYFDIEYVDDELLIICQQALPQQAQGGRFALVKVDNYDP
mmetsp:Transcript_15345/g.22863  ORF Transcript_15345/g.22863 Transcript_15345/m.22863 type:complete len:321 (-) Transcript_15345:124-1086(-)